MTASELLDNLEGYYGRYDTGVRPTVRRFVLQYLGGEKFTDNSRAKLFRWTLLRYTGRFGSPPDIAALEEVRLAMAVELDGGMLLLDIPKEERVTAEEIVGAMERVKRLAEAKRVELLKGEG